MQSTCESVENRTADASGTVNATQSVLVARQGIYDRQLNVVAYELLYRSGRLNQAVFDDADRATSELLVNSLLEIGFNQLVGSRPAFVNFPRSFLVGEREVPFTDAGLVIEVLEDVPADAAVAAGLRCLREQGFQLALDDFIDDDEREQLIGLVDIIKVDFMGCDRERLPEHVQRLRQYPVQLLAEKIETVADYELCHALGFDLFQGYFLSRPTIVEGRQLSGNGLTLLRLLAELHNPNVEVEDVIELIRQDVAFSLKLLRYVNSTGTAVKQRVESVRQAAVILGLKRIRQIVTLISLSSFNNKPQGFLEDILLRAHMCEQLGAALGRHDCDACFTVGLFSYLEALMEVPLADIVQELPLTDDLNAALLHQHGKLGQILQCAMAFERADWDAASLPGLNADAIQHAYLEAMNCLAFYSPEELAG